MSKDTVKYHLKLLKLKEDASLIEIRNSYRNEAKIHHPDKSNDSGELFNEIKTAYNELTALREAQRNGSLLKESLTVPIRKRRSSGFQKEKITYLDIIESRKFWAFSLTILNLILVIKIGFNTVITPLQLFVFIATFCIISTVFLSKTKKYRTIFIGHFAAPFLIANSFLCVNYIFSDKATTELHYIFSNTFNATHGTAIIRNESTLIVLENNAYHDYPGIRLHFDLRPLLFANAVEFHFETGLFGFKVLKKSIPLRLHDKKHL
ncbi:MAG: hypothetical protein ACJA0Q_000620 [Saprospiraceae bacterium]|jgi:hypothetical protein